jgi:hypothetical protein
MADNPHEQTARIKVGEIEGGGRRREIKSKGKMETEEREGKCEKTRQVQGGGERWV